MSQQIEPLPDAYCVTVCFTSEQEASNLYDELVARGLEVDSGVAHPEPPDVEVNVVSVWFISEQEAIDLCNELVARGLEAEWDVIHPGPPDTEANVIDASRADWHTCQVRITGIDGDAVLATLRLLMGTSEEGLCSSIRYGLTGTFAAPDRGGVCPVQGLEACGRRWQGDAYPIVLSQYFRGAG